MRFVLKILNIGALLLLLISCAGTYIAPVPYWQLSFISFGFPAILILNIAFLFLWILWRDAFGLVTLIALALTWSFIKSVTPFHFSTSNKKGDLKLMTWNVKNFDLYNWSKNIETRKKMFSLIARENPDVLCVQEFYTNNQQFKNLEYLRDSLGYKYIYFPPSIQISRKPKSSIQKLLWKHGILEQEWGVATFSKFPIVSSGIIEFKERSTNSCIYTNIRINDSIVCVYNVHFESVRLNNHDYANLDSIEQEQKLDKSTINALIQKMAYAYRKRAAQADAVSKHMKDCNSPKLICGDFNDVPVSYTYTKVSQDMTDAFVTKGMGFGVTYAHKFSIFRIDYTLFDKNFRIDSYKRMRRELSDHYPVIVTFSL